MTSTEFLDLACHWAFEHDMDLVQDSEFLPLMPYGKKTQPSRKCHQMKSLGMVKNFIIWVSGCF